MTSQADLDATLDATLSAGPETTHATRRRGEAHGPGATLGRYILLDRVGSGGMGVVYAAYDPELDRKLAIKLLWSQGGDAGLRMMREAQAMAKVDHRNVVAVHDVGRVGEQVFVAMEFVDGQTLRAWLDQQPREHEVILSVLLAAGEGLLAAHRAGLVHRDFKPDNVLIAPDGPGWRVRVTDFGLARASDAGSPDPELVTVPEALRQDAFATPLTQAGSVLGTPRYMAPEQHLGQPTDARSDQFAFCVTAWEALTGKHPYPAESLAAMILAVTEGQPRGGESLPPWLRTLLLRGLAVDPEQRFPSMDVLLAALARDPRRKRRRVLALLGVIALGAGTLLGVRLDEQRRTNACAEAGASITTTWSSTSATELAQRFASVSDYGEEAARRTVAALDRFAQRWQATREASCLAATVDRSRTAAEAARADECLADARARFDAHVEVFADVDRPPLLHEAVRASAQLPDPRLCNDVGHLASVPDVPSSGAGERAELRRLFARVEALGLVGRNDEADASASEALTKAEALGEPRWIALALHVQGQRAFASERWDQAEHLLTDAFHRALVSRDDLSAAAIVLDLCYVIRKAGRSNDEARLWAQLGRTLVDRADASESLLAAQLEFDLGSIAIDSGELERADSALHDAEQLFASKLGTDDIYYSLVTHELASLAMERGQWAQGDQHFATTLALREQTLGPDHEWVADTLLSIGASYEVRGLFEQAEQAYARALPIYESSRGPDGWAVAAVHNNLGVVQKARGHLDEAEQHYLRAVDIWTRTLGPDAVVLAHPAWGLSGIAYERGDAAAAIEHAQRCVELRRANKVAPGELAEAQLALARALWLQGEQRERALELAAEVRSVYASEGERRREDLERLDAWLLEIGAPTQ